MAVCVAPCFADDAASPQKPSEEVARVTRDAAADAPATNAARRDPAPNAVSALALQREGAMEPAPALREVPLAVAAASDARWHSSATLVDDAYRVSLQRGRLDLGMSFDTAARASHPHDVRVDGQGPVISTLPSVSLGLVRFTGHDATASSLLARATADGNRGSESRVGVQWKPAESQAKFLREGLGMRLDSNESITMRLRKGLFGVYLQRRF